MWWNKENRPAARFEDLTLGWLLREFYREKANELVGLRNEMRSDGHSPDLEARIGDLERIFSDAPDLASLDEDESLDNWAIARRTGDPLLDKWEAQIAAGETPDLDDEAIDV